MLGSKNTILVDRRVYAFKGIWQNPQQDVSDICYYFISQQMTLTTEYRNGREQLRPQMEITIYGEKPIVVGDHFTLQSGEKYRVLAITYNYVEHNIAVRDMLKQKISNMIITLG